MKRRLWIGEPADGDRILVEEDVAGIELLTDAAAAHLMRDGELIVPWRLALAAADLLDDDGDRDETVRKAMPGWLGPDDVEVLLDVVAAAQLPKRTPLRLRLGFEGVAGRPGFRLVAAWVAGGGRVVREQPRVQVGTIQNRQGPPRRLTLGQFDVLAQQAALTGLGVDRSHDLAQQARFCAAPPDGDPGIVFDRALEANRVGVVEAVVPRLAQSPGGYQVRPAIAGISQQEADDYFYETPASELGRRPLVARDGGVRTRTVFTERAVAGLQACRRLDEISTEEAAHALSHPDEYFDPSLDLSQLSERVTGLGPEIRPAYPVLRELKGTDWWDWDMPIALGSDESGEAGDVMSLKDPATRNSMKDAIARADEKGDCYVPAPDGRGFVPITEQLREAVRTAETLAEKVPAPARSPNPPREVLQVLENVETITFDRGRAVAEAQRLSLGPPPGVRATLYPYQQLGYEWMASLYAATPGAGHWRGALLADDMGLGKTIQVLSFLAWRRSQGASGPHLVVAPVALLDNWQREAQKFFGLAHEPIVQVIGRALPDEPAVAAARLGSQHLVLVSYETLRQKEAVFARVPWDVVILDEAQKAKDPTTQVARVVRTLKARFRLAMTGTPVENTLRELWTIYDWVAPGLLGSLRDFGEGFIKPIQAGDDAARLATTLHDRIRPVFLRRLKRDALSGLPPIRHHRIEVGMSPEQEQHYDQIISAPHTGARTDALGRLIRLFAVLLHSALVSRADDDDLPARSELDFPRARAAMEILEAVAARGEKAIVFSNRKKVQAWLAREIGARFGCRVDVINGDLDNSRARLKRIDEFSAAPGFGALVLAPRAAGVGLNITAANHVLHYSREWNPAIENQATDRAYRLGQDRQVEVYYLVATSPHGTTVDERLDQLLGAKRALMDDFVVPMGGLEISPEEFGLEKLTQ